MKIKSICILKQNLIKIIKIIILFNLLNQKKILIIKITVQLNLLDHTFRYKIKFNIINRQKKMNIYQKKRKKMMILKMKIILYMKL
jgi:hypothetical protein